MCEWRGRLDTKYRCKVRAEPESKYCIFHEPGEKDIGKFRRKFRDQIDEIGPIGQRNSRYNFTGYVFPEDVGIGPAKVSNLPRHIQDTLVLNEAVLKGDLDLERGKLMGSFLFQKAVVEGEADLRQLRVFGDVFLSGSRFKRDLCLSESTITGDLYVEDTQIDGNAFLELRRVIHLCLARTQVKADLFLTEATIQESLNAYRLDVAGNAFFPKLKVGGEAFLLGAAFRNMIDLREAVFDGETVFRCHAERLELGNGRPTILPIVRNREGVSLADVRTASSFWRFARVTLEKQGRKEEADAAHYFERMYRWKALRAMASERPKQIPERRRWSKWLLSVLELLGIGLILELCGITLTEQSFEHAYCALLRTPYTFLWALDCLFLRYTTAYGSSLSRLFATWGVIVGAFAATYHLVGVRLFASASTGLAWPLSFGRVLYFSIITFTTLGYGDIKPTPGWGSALTATEAILGGIMMALTVLVIGRKFMR